MSKSYYAIKGSHRKVSWPVCNEYQHSYRGARDLGLNWDKTHRSVGHKIVHKLIVKRI